ncbi:MAG TPA: NAD(+) diphosphatase [Caulobacteraceae bacterium]|nr:NAD(+) diphosphatase [Caulobacteraceae bacterium]
MPLDAFTNVFAGNPLDRASYQRSQSEWVAQKIADPDSLAMVLWNGKPMVEAKNGGGSQIAYVRASMAEELSDGGERLLFMGLWKETAVFALDVEGQTDPADGPLQGMGRFEDLRAIALDLPAGDAAMAATAKAMFEWRRRHRYCSNCGQPSAPADGGWRRLCAACKTEHFPRTDPVVIMLAIRGDRCLLGRQAIWPKGMFSALAGFLEPGESIEEACAREIFEEAGLKTERVRYHSTQPWPYPSSLMIGLMAEVEEGEATPDQTELEEVRWFTRAEARELIGAALPGARAPGSMAIAYQLIKAWAEE